MGMQRPADYHAGASVDPFNLSRFVDAQSVAYDRALEEVRAGRKRSHWMWYVFPQLRGLGVSRTSELYGIGSAEEARAYLGHPVLGPRLVEIAEAAVAIRGRSAREVFGFPDDLKLRSSATLFASISPDGSVFHRLLDRYFGGQADDATRRLLGERS